MPAEEGCLSVLHPAVAQDSGRVSWAREWRWLFSKAPRSFVPACSSPTLWSSVTSAPCARGRAGGRPSGPQTWGSWRRGLECSPWGAGGQAGCFMESGGVLRQPYLLNAKKPSWFNMIVAAALINQNN